MKTNYLIALLIIILIIIVAIQFRDDPIQQSGGDQKQAILTVNIVNPPEKIFSVIDPITLTFSEPIDESSIFIKTSPEEPITTSFNTDRTTLSIEPVQTWRYGATYTVTITYLGQDYKVNFTTEEYRGI